MPSLVLRFHSRKQFHLKPFDHCCTSMINTPYISPVFCLLLYSFSRFPAMRFLFFQNFIYFFNIFLTCPIHDSYVMHAIKISSPDQLLIYSVSRFPAMKSLFFKKDAWKIFFSFPHVLLFLYFLFVFLFHANSAIIFATCSIFSHRHAFSPQNSSASSVSPFAACTSALVIQYGVFAGLQVAIH